LSQARRSPENAGAGTVPAFQLPLAPNCKSPQNCCKISMFRGLADAAARERNWLIPVARKGKALSLRR